MVFKMNITRLQGFDWTYVVRDPEQGLLEVDIAAYGGVGSCTCRAFMFSCKTRLESGEHVSDKEDLRCDHIRAAWTWIREHELYRLSTPYMARPVTNGRMLVGI